VGHCCIQNNQLVFVFRVETASYGRLEVTEKPLKSEDLKY